MLSLTPRQTRTACAAAVFFLGAWWVNRQADAWLYAWADEGSGRPTLTGTWVGQMVTGGGQPRALLLELHRWFPENDRSPCPRCPSIEGSALVCDARGAVVPYSAGGDPGNRMATQMQVGVSPSVKPPPDGLELSVVRGAWAGDRLNLEAEFHWRRGTSAISSTADPETNGWVPLIMRRGGEAEFRALCARIRRP
ncbi:MAG TPA: hypothetical protein VFE05_03090 [Longimicrobiaceae bacterium]|jgi:hypothetical protein|nr:hypothetical protein [Longimicrobiaceae bacterium]